MTQPTSSTTLYHKSCYDLVKSKGFGHQMILYRVFCVLLVAWTIHADPGRESEHFEEDLVIRPLKDGRIGARFSFTTTLEDISPRNPESLGGDEDCMSLCLREKMCQMLIDPATQPNTIPFSLSLSDKSFGNTQSPNCISP